MAGVYGNMLAIPNRGRGGALPTYQGGNQPYTPGANVSARLSDAGGQIAGASAEASARALGNLAGAADKAVQTGVRAYEDYSKTRATQLLVEYQTRVNDAMYGEGGILTRKGDAAFDADKELARRSQEIREEVLGDYKGSLAGNFFDVRIREFDANNMLKAQKYRGDQYDAWAVRENIAAMDMLAKRAAGNYGNRAEFLRCMGELEWHQDQFFGIKGYGPEARAKGRAEARSAVLGMSIQQAIANGDMAGAERLLHQFGGGGRGSVGGSTSSRNLAANNFGNVKNSAGGFNAYATREDGLMGVGERVLRYNNAPERGWKAQTLEEMTAIYAPDSDGNDSKGYAAFLAKKLGVAPDAKINFRDPKILAGLIRWMPVMEHGGDRVKISAEEADKAAKELLEGKKPRITGAAEGVASNSTGGAAPSLFGLSPADRMKFQGWIESAQRSQQAKARVLLDERMSDAEAAWKDGLEAPNAPSRAEINAAYGKDAPKVWEQMESLRAYSADVRALRDMTPEQQNILLRDRTPQTGDGYARERQVYAMLSKAVEQDRKMRESDPGAYLARAVSDVENARIAMFQSMTPENVNNYAVALETAKKTRGMRGEGFLPKGDAAILAENIQSSSDPVASLAQLSSLMGKHWPVVNKQLSKDGNFSTTMAIVASGMKQRSGNLLLEAGKDKDFSKKSESILVIKGTTKTEFESLINKEMSEFNRTFLAGGDSDFPYVFNQSVKNLALQYMMQEGYETNEAVSKAANEVALNRYSVVGTGTRVFRVPADQNPDSIWEGAEASLDALAAKPSSLQTIKYKQMGANRTDVQYANMVRKNGYWVTNGDESGVVLFVGGQVVRDKSGNVISRTWDELDMLGREIAAAKLAVSREDEEIELLDLGATE